MQRLITPGHTGQRSQAVRDALGPCGGAIINLIASASARNTTTITTGITDPIDTTGASLLVACYARTGVIPTFTDSESNVWTPALTQQCGGGGLLYLHTVYAWRPTTSLNHTFTINGAAIPLVVGAWNGIAVDSNPLDQVSGAKYNQTDQRPWTPGTIVTATDEELIISTYSVYGPTVSIGVHYPVRLLDVSIQGQTGVNWPAYLAYTIQKQAGPVTVTWDAVTNYDNALTIASFRNRNN